MVSVKHGDEVGSAGDLTGRPPSLVGSADVRSAVVNEQ
jgi:hypothetical protein